MDAPNPHGKMPMPQCTALSKQSRQRCKRHAAVGRAVCSIHGGKTPAGIASANYKTGRYSKVMPKRLLETYEAARLDPDLLNLSDDISALDARIADVLTRVETGDAGETWQALKSAWNAFRIAQAAKDGPKTQLALATIGRTIETGAGDWAAWREVLNLIERRSKLVGSETKRRIAMQDMTDNGAVMALLQRLGDAVKRHVPDRDARQAIQREISVALGNGPSH
jgi:hypothetical protein